MPVMQRSSRLLCAQKAICLAWRRSSYTLPQAKATRVEPFLCMAWDPKDTEALANNAMATILPKTFTSAIYGTSKLRGEQTFGRMHAKLVKACPIYLLRYSAVPRKPSFKSKSCHLCTRYTARSLNILPSCTPNGMPAAGACCHRCTSLRQSVPGYTSMRHLQKREIQRTDMGQGIVRKSKHDLQRPTEHIPTGLPLLQSRCTHPRDRLLPGVPTA